MLLGVTLILIFIAASALALIENGINPEITGFVLHAPDVEQKPIVVLAPNIDPKMDFEDPLVVPVQGDPTVARDLKQAGIEKASAAIILGSFNGNHDNSSDARAVLITLAIESINPAVRTCVEVSDPANIPHLEYAKADEIVNSGGLSANLLSQAALYPGITQVYTELLSNIVGNEIYQIEVPSHYAHHTVRELHSKLLEKGCILVGVRWLSGENKGKSKINPPLNIMVMPGDELMLISEHRPRL